MVSVIIPCYNHGAFIQEAIDSVKAQTYKDWEIIIVNDGSDDVETIEQLDRLKQKGFYVIDISNSGVSVARNLAIAVAKGDFIMPLDADDKIAPRYLEEALKVFQDKAEVKLVYSECEYFGSRTGISPVPTFTMDGMLFENLIFNSALFKKSIAIQIGGYDETFLEGWEDWEFYLRFIKDVTEVYKLPAINYFYRIKQVSRNSLIKDRRREICEQQIYKKHIALFLKYNPKPISALTEYSFYKNEYTKLNSYRDKIHQSFSYRIGNFILKPLKLLKVIFKNGG